MLKEKALNLNVVFYVVTLVFIFTVFFRGQQKAFSRYEGLLEQFCSHSCAALTLCHCPSYVCATLSRAGAHLKGGKGENIQTLH